MSRKKIRAFNLWVNHICWKFPIFRDVRAFRVYNGTSEVHRMSLSRSLKTREAKAKTFAMVGKGYA